MKSLATIVSARASYSRVRSVLIELEKNQTIDSHIILTASAASPKFGRLASYLDQDSLKVSWKIESQHDTSTDSSMIKTTATSMTAIADYLLNCHIDGVLVVADRHETIAASIASSYLNRKTFHLQGGEVSGNIDNKVRFANSLLSDYHFVSTQGAAKNLELCGLNPSSIFVTGCPSLDLVKLGAIDDLYELNLGGIGLKVDQLFQDNFIVVLQHPETDCIIAPRKQIQQTIDVIDELNFPALWIWPNSDSGSDDLIREISSARESGKLRNVHFERNIDPNVFLQILGKARCIIGNSSVAIRECSLIGTPAVNIGGRQKNRERGKNVIDVDFSSNMIRSAIAEQLSRAFYEPSNIYGDGQAGSRIASLISKILHS